MGIKLSYTERLRFRFPLAQLLICLLALVLTACASTGDEQALDEDVVLAPEPAAPTYTSMAQTPKEAVRIALEFLQVGDAENAKIELLRALELDPRHLRAQSLLVQIETAPQDYFGSKYRTYRVQRGDSLSTIAARAFKDPYQFYALAKYNGITAPNELTVGQSIKIPTTLLGKPASGLDALFAPPKQPSTPPTKAKPSAPEPEPTLASDSGSDSIPQTTPEAVADAPAPRDNESSVDLAAEEADDSEQNNFDKLFQEAAAAEAAGNNELAVSILNDLLDQNPDYPGAREKRDKLQADWVEQRYQSGLDAYRKQDLDEAILIWDEVLALDPKHQPARLYRDRAVDLQSRLNR